MIRTARRVFLAVAVIGAAGAAAQVREAFSLAVLRRDGALVPFAAFDGRNWRNEWPVPQIDLTVPINIESVPKRWWGPPGLHDVWDAWIGGHVQIVHVSQPDWVDVHCARHIALQTDYRGDSPPPPTEQPYPKDGLAIYPSHPIDTIDVLATDGPATRDLMPVLLAGFNHAERETASRFGHPIGKRSREGIQPTIEAMYAFGDSSRYVYVEATRQYREIGRADDCAALAFGTGWFVQEGGAFRLLLTVVDILTCDRVGASYMLPLGVVRADNRLFWIAQFSGWHHERYAVIELKPKAVQLMVSTWGGGC